MQYTNVYSVLGNERAKGHIQYAEIFNEKYEVPEPPEKKDFPSKEADSVFNMIFSVNPITKLPEGDIAIFMSENTSPEVRDFISRNMMQDNGLESDGHGDYKNLSDDDLVKFSRNDGESSSDYRLRMYDLVKSEFETSQKQDVSD